MGNLIPISKYLLERKHVLHTYVCSVPTLSFTVLAYTQVRPQFSPCSEFSIEFWYKPKVKLTGKVKVVYHLLIGLRKTFHPLIYWAAHVSVVYTWVFLNNVLTKLFVNTQ